MKRKNLILVLYATAMLTCANLLSVALIVQRHKMDTAGKIAASVPIVCGYFASGFLFYVRKKNMIEGDAPASTLSVEKYGDETFIWDNDSKTILTHI